MFVVSLEGLSLLRVSGAKCVWCWEKVGHKLFVVLVHHSPSPSHKAEDTRERWVGLIKVCYTERERVEGEKEEKET